MLKYIYWRSKYMTTNLKEVSTMFSLPVFSHYTEKYISVKLRSHLLLVMKNIFFSLTKSW